MAFNWELVVGNIIIFISDGSNTYFATVLGGNVMIDVVRHKAWLAWTESRGVQKLSQLRMDSGSWEIYMYGDSCLSATDDLKVL